MRILKALFKCLKDFSECFPGWVILSCPELAGAQPLLCRLHPFQAAVLWALWVCHPKPTAVTLPCSVLPWVLQGRVLHPPCTPGTPAAQAEQGKLDCANPSSSVSTPEQSALGCHFNLWIHTLSILFTSGPNQSLHTAVGWFLAIKGRRCSCYRCEVGKSQNRIRDVWVVFFIPTTVQSCGSVLWNNWCCCMKRAFAQRDSLVQEFVSNVTYCIFFDHCYWLL